MNSDMAFMFMSIFSMGVGMTVMYVWMKYGK